MLYQPINSLSMEKTSVAPNQLADRELIISRDFEISRNLLFEAWTDPVHLDNWWGPENFQTSTDKFDLRNGGSWHLTMNSPYGEFSNIILYDQVVSNEQIRYTLPGGLQTIVLFTAIGNNSNVLMRLIFESADELHNAIDKYGALESGNQTLDRLTIYLAEKHGKPIDTLPL